MQEDHGVQHRGRRLVCSRARLSTVRWARRHPNERTGEAEGAAKYNEELHIGVESRCYSSHAYTADLEHDTNRWLPVNSADIPMSFYIYT